MYLSLRNPRRICIIEQCVRKFVFLYLDSRQNVMIKVIIPTMNRI